jgi:hypothetical protein
MRLSPVPFFSMVVYRYSRLFYNSFFHPLVYSPFAFPVVSCSYNCDIWGFTQFNQEDEASVRFKLLYDQCCGSGMFYHGFRIRLSGSKIFFSSQILHKTWNASLLFLAYYAFRQGCGSGLIQCGSGSSILALSGSGSGSKLKQNFRRQCLSQILLKPKFESNQIKKIPVLFIKFISQKVVSAILYLFSGKFFLNN